MSHMRVDYDEAKRLIMRIVADGRWHASTEEIHKPLEDRVPDWMFGRAKKEQLAGRVGARRRSGDLVAAAGDVASGR